MRSGVGLEALGRGSDLQALNQYLNIMPLIDQQAPDVDKREAKVRVANALNINHRGLLKTPEQVAQEQQLEQQRMQQEQQQQQLAEIAKSAVGPAVASAGRQLENSEGQQQQAQQGE